ncbi:7743_t:CDS:2 [Diversispora eburnea]|uniref:7743_t:CDS:1 n=1 Tax=Diversispora eburnea TaxID=1213867 RepID=A0A9N8Z7U6_9GLOM|nr:7743_t:CDS:2 [Diversispora eburnea]
MSDESKDCLLNKNSYELSDDTSVRPIPPESPAYPSSPITHKSQDFIIVPLVDEFSLECLEEEEEDKCWINGEESNGIDNFKKKEKNSSRKLLIAIGISLIFFGIELFGGFISGSLALLCDSFHLLSDVISFAISFLSIYLARRPATNSHSYGYHRAEILGALLSIFLIWLLTGFLCLESYYRIYHPRNVDGRTMFTIACIGVLVNISKVWIDPFCTFFFSALVMASTFGILKSSVRVLMEATPFHIDAQAVKSDLNGIEGVKSVHDLHIWDLTFGKTALTSHLILQKHNPEIHSEPFTQSSVLLKAKKILKDKYEIHKVTIQVDQP